MSAALLLTVALTGSHNCCCPTYSSHDHAASYGYNYSPSYSYGYSPSYNYGSRSYSYTSPDGYSSYRSLSRGSSYRAPGRSYAYRSANGTYGRRSADRSYADRSPDRSPDQNIAGAPRYEERRAGFTPQPPSGSNIVQMMDSARFEPALITINAGETVEWKNVSRHPHTITANPDLAKNPAHVILPQGAEPFHSGEVAAGGQFSHKFTTPGTYYYVCLLHGDIGMVGIVVVKPTEEAGPPDANAPARSGEQSRDRSY